MPQMHTCIAYIWGYIPADTSKRWFGHIKSRQSTVKKALKRQTYSRSPQGLTQSTLNWCECCSQSHPTQYQPSAGPSPAPGGVQVGAPCATMAGVRLQNVVVVSKEASLAAYRNPAAVLANTKAAASREPKYLQGKEVPGAAGSVWLVARRSDEAIDSRELVEVRTSLIGIVHRAQGRLGGARERRRTALRGGCGS